MAKATIAIDPVTRIEGHLKAQVVVENGKVVDAHLTGGMFRGFEQILKGRDPRDSTQIVQRICGVCPTSHAMASALAQESAFNIKVTGNGRITRNLILGANYLQSHILHFYHLAALDFVAGQTTQSVSFVNPEENDCYFIISILLPDGTNIYTSQLIPPGKGLYEIELDTPLETGEYEGAQLQYRCIDMEDTSIEYNGANMALTLRVS